jgi:hypothetical protein
VEEFVTALKSEILIRPQAQASPPPPKPSG